MNKPRKFYFEYMSETKEYQQLSDREPYVRDNSFELIHVIEISAYDKAIEALKEANGFLECFAAGQKRMRHDLNAQDTMEAVALYLKIKKLLGEV